jgi:hypothetical protein
VSFLIGLGFPEIDNLNTRTIPVQYWVGIGNKMFGKERFFGSWFLGFPIARNNYCREKKYQ